MRRLRPLVAVAILLAVPCMASAEDRGLERDGSFRDIVVLQTYDEKTNRRNDIDLYSVTNASGQHDVDDPSEGVLAKGFRSYRR
jgi:hypothetical protein